jgi:hypothetical protein
MNNLGRNLVLIALPACLFAQSLQSQEPEFTQDHRTSRKPRTFQSHQAVHFQIGDVAFPRERSDISIQSSDGATGLVVASEEVYPFPQQVSHAAGRPAKPLVERPGDINLSDCPPRRYGQDDNVRSGWPQSLRRWTHPSVNSHYSAWYVGGGSAWIWPHDRQRSCQEGTWGLDYSTWKKPGTVWMHWTEGRWQGGLGAYETDR